ncbi:uncharacterized protein LOC132611827 [Lycium barbarum]|uniref:uncharacterized protein LOC132611827 n=1 Tax=Lycium barbarum TaxID=112863 RepID=UPI00293EED65|nr:uncharacterized protein LOC132611827 [Lycium barbarum]
MDVATKNRTRPRMDKVRVEVNLTKTKLTSNFVGTEDTNCPRKGFYKNLEYENVPKFCTHCKLLGHLIIQCGKVEKKRVDEMEDMEKKNNKHDNNITDGEFIMEEKEKEVRQQEMQKAKNSSTDIEEKEGKELSSIGSHKITSNNEKGNKSVEKDQQEEESTRDTGENQQNSDKSVQEVEKEANIRNEEGTGDNLTLHCGKSVSSILPSQLKILSGINLDVDLNHNVLVSFSTQDKVATINVENAMTTTKIWLRLRTVF